MDVKASQECLQNLGGVLGLTLAPETADTPDNLAAQPFIEMLLATRQKLREAKQYALADQIRDDLDRQGRDPGRHSPGFSLALPEPRLITHPLPAPNNRTRRQPTGAIAS